MMTSRHWRGLARPDAADAYVSHLRAQTLPQLAAIAGFVDATVLRRRIARGVEFLVVTRWQSRDAIAAFAGADIEAAVVPAQVLAMMVEFDSRARHYEVVASASASP